MGRNRPLSDFIAYSAPDADERDMIYKALNWQRLGVAEQGPKAYFVSPTGDRISSYDFNRRNDGNFCTLGWNGTQAKYEFLRSLGWFEVQESRKVRWLHVVPR